MLFNSTSTILQSKFSLMYKIILCLFIFILVFVALGMGTIYPTLHEMLGEIGELHLVRSSIDYVKSVFKGLDINVNSGALSDYEALLEKFAEAKQIVNDYAAEVTVSLIILFILIFMFCMSVSMSRYTTVSILHTFMSCNGDYGFTSCFLGTIKKSIPFAFAFVGFSFIYYTIVLSIVAGIGFLMSFYNQFLGLMLTYLLLMVSFAIKRALMGMWLPEMIVNDHKVIESFTASLRMVKKTFLTSFGANFFIYLMLFIVGTLGSLVTLGVASIVFLALGIFLIQTYELVLYYQTKQLKYYIDNQRVVDPTKRYREAVLDSVVNEPVEVVIPVEEEKKEEEKK